MQPAGRCSVAAAVAVLLTFTALFNVCGKLAVHSPIAVVFFVRFMVVYRSALTSPLCAGATALGYCSCCSSCAMNASMRQPAKCASGVAAAAAALNEAVVRLGGEYCFRKLEVGENDGVCRGLMEREFKSKRRCCSSGGAAFSNELHITNLLTDMSEYKYRCTPCRKPLLEDNDTLLSSSQVGWSHWSHWSQCSETCGAASQRRERFCLSQRMTQCAGSQYELRDCPVVIHCPVDGAWGSWQSWSRCSAACGRGQNFRLRRCDSPAPQHGGRNCSGASLDLRECRDRLCSVDGSWGEWSYASQCSVSCGQGTRLKVRNCNNPTPRRRGRLCTLDSDPADEGSLYEEIQERCEQPPCAGEDALSSWSAWSACTVTCGSGVQVRSRGSHCDPEQLKYGIANCSGTISETMRCYSSDLCAVDGGWSEFGNYTACSAKPCSGEAGVRTRNRTCTNPPPLHGGRPCDGESVETQECFSDDAVCQVDGGWCAWHPWGPCVSYEPANRNMTIRMRSCSCPPAARGGEPCHGKEYEVTSCEELSRQQSTTLPHLFPDSFPQQQQQQYQQLQLKQHRTQKEQMRQHQLQSLRITADSEHLLSSAVWRSLTTAATAAQVDSTSDTTDGVS